MRRTMLAPGLLTITSTTRAATQLSVKSSFKNSIVFILSNFNQCTHPEQTYAGGLFWYLNDSVMNLFSPYVWLDLINPNKISLTHSSDIGGGGHGQCVTFMKSTATMSVASSAWIGGAFIVNSLPSAGTPIAVFSKPGNPDKYDSWGGSGHAAIYLGTTTNNSGIVVMDQNYDYTQTLAIHVIPWYGNSGTTNAQNYRTILV